ncbi:hypothetical protein O8C99_09005 [Aliarcobacter butzleri]|jgi:hypothetical protein|nr:hypothetical protein [Aliarcobacter butzleri]MDN5083585.1 hypothetical protein [Aliarcobacter butzleri]MDN5103323.1 hypothetical protein [Aliarcobacter butzleri]
MEERNQLTSQVTIEGKYKNKKIILNVLNKIVEFVEKFYNFV